MVLLFLGDIGGGELALIAVVALVVLGPQRFPEIARKMGRLMGQFRRASTDLQRQLNNELRDADPTSAAGGPGLGAQAASWVSRLKGEVAGVASALVAPTVPPAEVTSSRPLPADVVDVDAAPAAEARPVEPVAAEPVAPEPVAAEPSVAGAVESAPETAPSREREPLG